MELVRVKKSGECYFIWSPDQLWFVNLDFCQARLICLVAAQLQFFRVWGTSCQAYFAVGTRKHKLFMHQYDMQHNYPTLYHIKPSDSIPSPPAHHLIPASSPPLSLDIPGYDAVNDFNLEFLRIFGTSLSFDSFDELQAKIDKFQLITGN
ncbi:hypothetical protein ACTXT7_001713 [Hymenolepis weldensis]